MVSNILILSTTFLSGITFSVSCMLVYVDLDSFFSVVPRYKSRLRKASLTLIFTQIMRLSYNLFTVLDTELITRIKADNENPLLLPDENYFW